MGSRIKDIETKFFTPKDYQLELLNCAIDHNTIVTLGTGFDKTFIAVLLIKEYALYLLENHQKAVFIVDKVSSIEQHAAHIECQCSLLVARVHGHLNCSFKTKQEFNEFFCSYHVLVITAQTFFAFLNHAFFELSNAALLIFDECHHSLKKWHSYRLILDYYRQLPFENRGRILGLTASVINKKVSFCKLKLALNQLEKIMCSRLEAINDLTAKKMIYFVHNNDVLNPVMDVDPKPSICEAVERIFSILDQLGLWFAWRASIICQKRLQKHIEDPIFGPNQKRILKLAETAFFTCTKILSDQVGKIKSYVQLKPFINSKVLRLLELLRCQEPAMREQNGLRDSISAIIFVKERFVAFLINVLLRELSKWQPKEFKFINSDFVVGHSSMYVDTEEANTAHKRQESVLQKFRINALNLLVATSVLEEGLDIRNCNLVIRFDLPLDFRSFVQSRGRARKENASFYIFCYESEYNRLTNDLSFYDQVEQFLQLYVHDTICQDDVSCTGVDFLPYIVEQTKARVTMSSAIGLINRYCAKLPSDVFTRLVPQFRHYEVQCGANYMYKAELVFPINSPVKEIITLTEPVATKSLALMAVALQGCKILHERKELNDYLVPVGKSTVSNLLNELEGDEYILLDNTKKTKRRWLYDRKLSKSLIGTLPEVGSSCFIYIIEMRLVKPIAKDCNPKNRRILDPAEIDTSFGFLSKKILPVIPGFLVYQRQGEMQINIRRVDLLNTLTNEDMDLIELFHCHIFYDILGMKRDEMVFRPDHSPMPLLVVPLRKVTNIDCTTNYVLDYQNLKKNIRNPLKMPPVEIRKKFKFNAADFHDAVVIPWYRSPPTSYYYVAEICHDLQPSSSFPDTKFTNFNEYFKTKYSLEIYDQNQCLLDVDHTSARMNLLLPRMPSAKRNADDLSQRQLLVPELVHVHHLSMPHWAMLIALPTIMYRLNSLLLADELRAMVMKEAFQKNCIFPDDFEWDVLVYPTNDQTINKPIKNLEQLKLIVSKEEAAIVAKTELNVAAQNLQINNNNLQNENDDNKDFPIGVWNPLDAKDFKNDVTQISTTTRDEAIFDKVALTKYGEVWDDDEFVLQDVDTEAESYKILLDVEYYKGVVNLPPVSVEAEGWDKTTCQDESQTDIQKENLGLTVFANQEEFNINSLMLDLEVIDGGVRRHKCWGGNKIESIKKEKNFNSVKASKKKAFSEDVLEEEIKDASRLSKHHEEFVDLSEFIDENNVEDEILLNDAYLINKISDESIQNVPSIDVISKFSKFSHYFSSLPFEITNATYVLTAPTVAGMHFSFDENLFDIHFYGVTPTLLLQALTTSSSGDGINLERLETIGDSFLKLAVTNYLYHKHPDQHEGKLSFARSKEVSNTRLYSLGLRRKIPHLMEASKFDPHVNWLPPAYCLNSEFHALNSEPDAERIKLLEKLENDMDDCYDIENTYMNNLDGTCTNNIGVEHSSKADNLNDKICNDDTGWGSPHNELENYIIKNGVETLSLTNQHRRLMVSNDLGPLPFNMLTQQYIGNKSVADAVEALIGAHLIYLGPSGALKFMHWLDIKVLVMPPKLVSPLLQFIDTEDDPKRSEKQLFTFYRQFNFFEVEKSIQYQFGNKAYLVQAFTHSSYYKNKVTGCYQRLEFLGDAVLDYLITRFLFEHRKQYSPGVLTDLRSALVNNTIFASLAVKYNFHKHFIALCPGLYHMIEKFVNLCKSRNSVHCTNFNDEMFMITEDDVDDGHEEDIEVPKALGDIFESLAGADCGMKMDVVWRVFYNMMKDTVEECCRNPPQSPVRELFERKNYKAQFMKLERIIETGKVRVTVDVNGMRFVGMGRSYRIAKCTAAKRALKHLKSIEATNTKS